MTVPPLARQASERTAIAVVLPDPAGAKLRCTRCPLVARSRTSNSCDALSFIPAFADAVRASSTTDTSTFIPDLSVAVLTILCSAAQIRGVVKVSLSGWVYTEDPSARRRTDGSSMGSTRPSLRARGDPTVCVTSSATDASTTSGARARPRTMRCASAIM